MACPDELTLDLWLADALSHDEAVAVGAHVRDCAACTEAQQALDASAADLYAALALDADERAYLSGLDLGRTWRASHGTAPLAWGWIALASAIGAALVWWLAAPALVSAAAPVLRVGVGTLLLNLALGSLFGLGVVLIDLIRHPALGLNVPLLALLALALLFWPARLIPRRRTLA